MMTIEVDIVKIQSPGQQSPTRVGEDGGGGASALNKREGRVGQDKKGGNRQARGRGKGETEKLAGEG